MSHSKEYWNRKIRRFLHDPIDKMLGIPGHEQRASRQADALGCAMSEKTEYQHADVVAAGMDRAALPGYDRSNPEKNGAVDFVENPAFTHPISAGDALQASVDMEKSEIVTNKIIELMREDTGNVDERWERQEYFTYLFFMLRKRLATQNIGNLGFLWELFPADSRIPDHTIWNHNGMVAALGSCVELSDENEASVVVYSLSPVQSFIGKTRKLRDHWVGSVVLSWLTFEGICAVIEELGPDHILYPSLNDQYLVEEYLKRLKNKTEDDRFQTFLKDYESKTNLKKDSAIASFPNKFVFLAPAGTEREYTDLVQKRISREWECLADLILRFMKSPQSGQYLDDIFYRQTNNYWTHNWGAVRLVDLTDRETVENSLFEPEKFKTVFETLQKFADKYSGKSVVYPVTHSIAQTTLAITKTQPDIQRQPEPGEKCPVCGEFEVLHDSSDSEGMKAHQYSEAIHDFWGRMFEKHGETVVKEKEKLCAICSIKRFLPQAVNQRDKNHILATTFKEADTFPSTTYMALQEYFQRNNTSVHERKSIADNFHENETGLNNEYNETDNYYAILIMDGDKMGDLVNGLTVSATWRDVIHPAVVDRFEQGTLQKGIWEEIINEQRILSPTLHSTISEALGAFSVYAVPRIIKKHGGRLLYAGGDDVAAVMPLSTSMRAAEEIQRAYNYRFARITDTGVEPMSEADGSTPVFRLPGIGKGISISAGLLMVHHKQPLRGALEEAHHLLDDIAKAKEGRNSIAVCLKKRSGQPRRFSAKWDAQNPFAGTSLLESFDIVKEASIKKDLSTSLIYRLETIREMISAVLKKEQEHLSEQAKRKVIDIISYEVGHSGFVHGSKEEVRKKSRYLAEHLAGLVLKYEDEAWSFYPEVPIIARYLAKGGMQ
ncbi:type III-B CRISPR-associated protein Cas10/Cmr2 [Chitinivibrio alkaliphilus]|uniref:CRISPR/Cas system-associated protein Cas10 n=1 Tax=Chitinivibrio alkaliphilus ACht1 TaxID=1313304 RepID=U7D5D4_9BACT|nr:type III-B CRISPR-associated protein Cas10/Cmr2 [Chitinivibrio alkaliphilus]ERP30776.1 CRISPR/Cas system-associated protein Cas10 [Chitinivibrio alkaliphilus ACht1]